MAADLIEPMDDKYGRTLFLSMDKDGFCHFSIMDSQDELMNFIFEPNEKGEKNLNNLIEGLTLWKENIKSIKIHG